MMTLANRMAVTRRELDAIAWRFLGSEFTQQIYSCWPIDRRVEAYLLQYGPTSVIRDGSAYNALVERVMDNIATALRTGVLTQQQT